MILKEESRCSSITFCWLQ